MGESEVINEWPIMGQGSLHPIPANAKVAIAGKPMGVNPATFARGDDLDALGGDIKGGDG